MHATLGPVALVDLVRRAFVTRTARLELQLFETTDPSVVAAMLERFCASHCGTPGDGIFYRAGVGVVAGIRLTDETHVVVKVHRWNVSEARLSAIQRVQHHLASCGLPAPRPLAPPTPLGRGIATIEEYLPGNGVDGRAPGSRVAMASALRELVSASASVIEEAVGVPPILRTDGAEVWTEPHSVRFDFARTADGAEWIDELARRARTRLGIDALEPCIGHCDWRVENLGFDGFDVVAIYDWDSLARAPEPVIVGMNAAQFCTAWTSDQADPLPTVQEMAAFVDDYEHARGSRFTDAELDALDAANLVLICYGARCQHSDSRLHPEIGGTTSNRWFRLLRERGERFFGAH